MLLPPLFLGGCGSSADTAASGTAPADSAAAETGEAGAFDFASVSDVKFPLKEKLNMTVFVYATTTGGGTYQDNYVTDWIEEKTNIHRTFFIHFIPVRSIFQVII